MMHRLSRHEMVEETNGYGVSLRRTTYFTLPTSAGFFVEIGGTARARSWRTGVTYTGTPWKVAAAVDRDILQGRPAANWAWTIVWRQSTPESGRIDKGRARVAVQEDPDLLKRSYTVP